MAHLLLLNPQPHFTRFLCPLPPNNMAYEVLQTQHPHSLAHFSSGAYLSSLQKPSLTPVSCYHLTLF